MFRFLLELWPALLPLAFYLGWHLARRKKALRLGEVLPHVKDGPWFWAVLASIGIAIFLLLFWGVSADSAKGTYIPPHMENGNVVPGHLEPKL